MKLIIALSLYEESHILINDSLLIEKKSLRVSGYII